MLKERRLLRLDNAAMLLLGAVFLFLAVGLVMMSGAVYRRIMAVSDENDQMRTAFSYIANQVRRTDAEGGVQVGSYYGQDALMLMQDFDGIECITYIYCWNGSLRELFVEKGFELEPEAGIELISVQNISFQLNGQGLISVEADFDSGLSGRMLLVPRSNAQGGGA